MIAAAYVIGLIVTSIMLGADEARLKERLEWREIVVLIVMVILWPVTILLVMINDHTKM